MTPLLLAVTLSLPVRFGFPMGAAERGSNLGDMTYLFASAGLDGAYAFTKWIGLAGGFRWGLGIPAVCFGVDSCIASAGRDVTLTLGPRFYLPKLGPISPRIDARLGYEWFGYVVADGGASATRTYDGPQVQLELAAVFRLSRRWRFTPNAGIIGGTFVSGGLDTAIARTSGIVDRRVHGWVTIGAALELEL